MDLHTLEFLYRYGAWVLFFVICGWAFWRGGKTERIAAAITVVSWGIGLLTLPLDNYRPGPFSVAIDVATLICYGWLAIRSRRIWVFFITAANVNTLITHFIAKWLHLGAYGYITVLGVWGSYAPLICLGVGMWGYQRAKKRAAIAAAQT
ncbi:MULTISPECIES: hypothetical protein [Asticcacaulis]|uniref:hypothetical protein n=1 Tax=Asticcacaulis TaxID=76890 RepID=UPI001AE18EB5|nr:MULTISPECIES: hypothetical protein [Asticcacaulis]MBP2159472.1 hypothetical protein [Asticcacaulis solisilvae]MDR6800701.1 hypothetical protein [Asticcacaulis sp. BE141]